MDPSELESALRANTISVESVSTGDRVEVEYLTAFPARHVNHGEVGRACTAFIELAREGRWDPKPVEATALRAADDVQGSWRIEPEWIEALNDYRISEEDFSERVLDTLEEP